MNVYYRTGKGTKKHLSAYCADGRRSVFTGDIIKMTAEAAADMAPCKHCCTTEEVAEAAETAPAAPAMCPNTGVADNRRLYSTCVDCGKEGRVGKNSTLRAHKAPEDAPVETKPEPVAEKTEATAKTVVHLDFVEDDTKALITVTGQNLGGTLLHDEARYDDAQGWSVEDEAGAVITSGVSRNEAVKAFLVSSRVRGAVRVEVHREWKLSR